MQMPFSSPLAESKASPVDSRDRPYDLNAEIPPADSPSTPEIVSEFVMGPRQVASVSFVGILLLGLMSTIAYFAGRKNTDPVANKVTERVIERVIQAPVAPPAPAPTPTLAAKPVEPQPKAEVTSPILNRLYLQAGSVEVGMAEVIVEGLRNRGIPAIVGVGINSKVARILVGPFESGEQQRVLQKKVEELGFHPYPRSFTQNDLEQQKITPTEPGQVKQ